MKEGKDNIYHLQLDDKNFSTAVINSAKAEVYLGFPLFSASVRNMCLLTHKSCVLTPSSLTQSTTIFPQCTSSTCTFHVIPFTMGNFSTKITKELVPREFRGNGNV